MPRYDVELHILVDAKNENEAFANVRTHYAVINDPDGKVEDGKLLVDMHVGNVEKAGDDASVDDYA